MSRIRVNTVQVRPSRLPAEFEGLRIAQLSDLHLRRWNGVLDETRRRLLELDPELVVITGDIGDFHAEAQQSADLAARLLEGVMPAPSTATRSPPRINSAANASVSTAARVAFSGNSEVDR